MHGYDETHGFQTRLIFDPTRQAFLHEQVVPLDFASALERHCDLRRPLASQPNAKGSDRS